MTVQITEWEFTADVAKWITAILERNPGLPFSEAKCEQRGAGSAKRRDLTLLDKNKKIILTGEVKLPYRKDGSSPYNAAVVKDARAKAKRAGADYFFTWNVNELVLWETAAEAATWHERDYQAWTVVNVHRASQMEQEATITRIQTWLAGFLHEFARTLKGVTQIGHRSPDEKFIEALESALKLPVLMTLDELDEQYKKAPVKRDLDRWMREEQGWTIYTDADGIRENLERAAKFSCYALVNKLVFYEALLKRYGAKLPRLGVPEHIDTGENLRAHLERFFADARKVTGDYETVFGEDPRSTGNRIPYYADTAVPHWNNLINQIHEFDFSRLDYEVIGNIFERLISPEERHKYGQFYTRVEVVDLINSFAIRTGEEKVMDPACGGGTFLVRAYARKRELAQGRRHGQLLSDLYGVDVSFFATHLSTINLATRELIAEENYPQIARSDFFDVDPHKTFLTLPRPVKAGGLGTSQKRDVPIPPLDAIIANPPYVRQEDIPKAKNKPARGAQPPRGTKEFYQWLTRKESGTELSGRSDLHCYFWPHAASMLKQDGYLCFLTSSQWLDVEYGFKLQGWLLANFEILAVFESIDEPWFVGARVATTVTILRKQQDEKKRMANTVRFVQLRRPIRDILGHDGTTADAMNAADRFRDEILALTQNASNQRYRARLVRQGDLWQQGVKLGQLMGKSAASNDADDDEAADVQTGQYYGGKWGVHLRAPDLWFDLLDKYGDRLAPLADIAEVKYGIKSGADDFFYVRDVTSEYLNEYLDTSQFEYETGYPRKVFESRKVRLVKCGKDFGELKAIETEYLEPEIHSLMEIKKYAVTAADCNRKIFLCSRKPNEFKNSYAARYVKWGEKNNWHANKTCASRANDERTWYDLTGHRRAPALWPKERQYRHIAPANPERLVANCRLYEIYPPDEIDNPLLWGGILNSTWVLLSSYQFGRAMGNEGNWSTMVVDVNLMLVPDPRSAKPAQLNRVANAFHKLKDRMAMQFISERNMREMAYLKGGKEAELATLSDVSELEMPDRRELDDAVLELIGIKSKAERATMIAALYDYLREFFEATRQKEEKAIANKNTAKRRGAGSPNDLANQIYQQINEHEPRWLRRYDPDFVSHEKPYLVYDTPDDGVPELTNDMFANGGSVRFTKGKKQTAIIETRYPWQAELLTFLAANGVRGLVRVPLHEGDCKTLRQAFESYLIDRAQRIRELIEERTADEEMQEKVFAVLMPMVNA